MPRSPSRAISASSCASDSRMPTSSCLSSSAMPRMSYQARIGRPPLTVTARTGACGNTKRSGGQSRPTSSGTSGAKSWPSAPSPCSQITAWRGLGAVSVSTQGRLTGDLHKGGRLGCPPRAHLPSAALFRLPAAIRGPVSGRRRVASAGRPFPSPLGRRGAWRRMRERRRQPPRTASDCFPSSACRQPPPVRRPASIPEQDGWCRRDSRGRRCLPLREAAHAWRAQPSADFRPVAAPGPAAMLHVLSCCSGEIACPAPLSPVSLPCWSCSPRPRAPSRSSRPWPIRTGSARRSPVRTGAWTGAACTTR